MQELIENNTPSNKPASAQTAPSVTGKSSDPFKAWTIVFAILFIAAAAFAAWQTLQLNEKASKVSSLESTVSGLQAEIAKTDGDGDQDIATDGDTPVDSDTDKILAAADAHVRAPAARSADTYEYTIMVNKDGFARVAASVVGVNASGVAVWLKKVGENWTVLLSTQDSLSQETIDIYGIPEAVLQQ